MAKVVGIAPDLLVKRPIQVSMATQKDLVEAFDKAQKEFNSLPRGKRHLHNIKKTSVSMSRPSETIKYDA